MFDPFSLLMSWASKRGLDKLYANVVGWFHKPSDRQILIVGPGGVGKSTLARFLAGATTSDPITAGEYAESISTEHYSLSEKSSVQVVVLPGQTHRREATWDKVLSDVQSGKYRGIILIFAYGNHTLGDISYKNHRLYNENAGLEAFVKDYLKDCLASEVEILKTICDTINLCDQPIWLMSLVTKQDLWWEERSVVEGHYTAGDYSRIVENCVGRKKPDQFRHESVFVSLVIRNLVTGRDELLKKTVGGYDAPLQEKSFERLLQVFDGLMRWEEQHGK